MARLGEKHPDVGAALEGIATTYLQMKKPQLAREPLERALAIGYPSDRTLEARLRFDLARARTPVDVTLAREARAMLADATDKRSSGLRDEIDKWLAARL